MAIFPIPCGFHGINPRSSAPYGTGCSRYVDVLSTHGGYFATWQQSQPEGSQPLVLNFLPHQEAARLLFP
jgi:hypothetical protein